MDYISVKEAAAKFHLSERRVQKLCESSRIEGARRMSNVWLIPEQAEKPGDARLIPQPEGQDLLTLKEVCRELSISMATGKNWVKLLKLSPEEIRDNIPYFTRPYVDNLKKEIKSGANSALKSRRNKKFVSGNGIYRSYISPDSPNNQSVQEVLDTLGGMPLTDRLLRLLLAECALQLLCQASGLEISPSECCLLPYLEGRLLLDNRCRLVDDLLLEAPDMLPAGKEAETLCSIRYTYELGEDILGLLYISLKSIGSRKAAGAYYTPTHVVRQLIDSLKEQNPSLSHKTVLDPCCGTGNFLLQLPGDFSFEDVYGNDIDEISVKITRINMALKFQILDLDMLYSHITQSDYLLPRENDAYDFIIGNPPWGYEFTEAQKLMLRERYRCAVGKNIESYDVFIEQALSQLHTRGVLAFVLPEAILNVKTHTPIRREILSSSSIRSLEFLGNAFDQVQCPCILLQLVHTGRPLSCLGMTVKKKDEVFQIHTERDIQESCFSFLTNDGEYAVLQKILKHPRHGLLAGHADFALGIVTGDNKKYLTREPGPSHEPVLKGSDICRFRKKQAENYITFTPNTFQQCAPTPYYRAPEKLLYRFICSQLVFAYDASQTLSLNSCNIVIPKLPGVQTKYVMAVFNSRAAQFVFSRQFHSIKVLRSHIEQLPIPLVSLERQEEIAALTDRLAAAPAGRIPALYDELDRKIAGLFLLTEAEYEIIRQALNGENLFLE